VAWSTALGAVVLHAISIGLPSESVADVTVTTEAVLTVVYLAVFASAVGYVIYFDLLDRLGAIEINLVSYTVPVFAALSGWLVLSESVDALSALGFAVIFGGFVLLKRETLHERLGSLRQSTARLLGIGLAGLIRIIRIHPELSNQIEMEEMEVTTDAEQKQSESDEDERQQDRIDHRR